MRAGAPLNSESDAFASKRRHQTRFRTYRRPRPSFPRQLRNVPRRRIARDRIAGRQPMQAIHRQIEREWAMMARCLSCSTCIRSGLLKSRTLTMSASFAILLPSSFSQNSKRRLQGVDMDTCPKALLASKGDLVQTATSFKRRLRSNGDLGSDFDNPASRKLKIVGGIVRASGKPNIQVLLPSRHFRRSGSWLERSTR